MLSLAEELLLIALDNEKGTVSGFIELSLHYSLGGAILFELYQAHLIELDEKSKVVVSQSAGQNQLLENQAEIGGVLESIASEKRHRKIKYWIDEIGASAKKYAKITLDQLVKKNVLKLEHKTIQWVVPNEIFPDQEYSAKFGLKEVLRKIVFAGDKADLRRVALLTFLRASRLIDFVFTHDELRTARKKIDQFLNEDLGAKDREVLKDIESAIFTNITLNTSR